MVDGKLYNNNYAHFELQLGKQIFYVVRASFKIFK